MAAVDEKDEAGVMEILYYLSGLAARYAKEGSESDTKRLIEHIKEIGIASSLAGQEMFVTNTILLFLLSQKRLASEEWRMLLCVSRLLSGKLER